VKENVMVDQGKDKKVVPDNKSHTPPTTGAMSPGAKHTPTPTEANEKDVVKKPGDKGVEGGGA
jgi:hypothetical protein